jgi:carbamoylphosphate synthase large subunit
MTQVACIVDAYSTGADLAARFHGYGWRAVHVQSSAKIPDDFAATFKAEDFIANLVPASPEDREEIATRLMDLAPACVIAGTETGVPLADYLAARLGLPGNAPRTSSLRRNKYDMQEALRAAGLKAIAQHIARDAAGAAAWAAQHGIWPVVVKPVDSAGADGVRFCETPEEVLEASNAILGRPNRLGLDNSSVLVQERLTGQQYFINGVSISGHHVITEIWQDDKILVEGAGLICEKETLLDAAGPVQDILTDYLRKALDVLGVQEGPSHSELMLTDKGPVLIETAARMQGTILHEAVVAAIGESHVTLTAERYADPEAFRRRVGLPYSRMRNLYCVTLASSREGIIRKNNCRSMFEALPSFQGLFHTPEPGERLEKTRDLFSNPGIVYLCHPDRDQIEADYRHIRHLESTGALFELA